MRLELDYKTSATGSECVHMGKSQGGQITQCCMFSHKNPPFLETTHPYTLYLQLTKIFPTVSNQQKPRGIYYVASEMKFQMIYTDKLTSISWIAAFNTLIVVGFFVLRRS